MNRKSRRSGLVTLAKFSSGATVLALVFGLIGFQTLSPRTKAAGKTQTPETTQAVFTNSSPIAIPDAAIGSPYPSNIVVSGLIGSIPATPGSVKVTLNNFSHTFPDDVGIVLKGPTGAVLLLQDGAGGPGSVMTNVPYTISDSGATQLPDTAAWATGVYKPTNYYSPLDTFPAPGPGNTAANPGPAGAGTATLTSTFGGTNPNGTWSLFVADFVGGDSGSISGGWSLEITTGGTPNRAVMDFDGDGKSDDVVTRSAGGLLTWYFLNSAGFTGFPFGNPTGDTYAPGDYDGDGKWDVAVWRGSVATFYILQSGTNTLRTQPFGAPGDDARNTQDYDGDGKADPTVTRNVGGNLTFYCLRSSLGFIGVTFGNAATDVGIRGDFDGDGKADLAVYRTNTGSPANTFFVVPSGGGPLIARTFGNFSTDFISPADFDGDHKTDFAVWRGAGAGSDGNWYWLRSSDGAFNALHFGTGGTDSPVPGDYDGDGKTDQAIYRPGTPSTFYHLGATAGVTGVNFGTSGDTPVAFFQVR